MRVGTWLFAGQEACKMAAPSCLGFVALWESVSGVGCRLHLEDTAAVASGSELLGTPAPLFPNIDPTAGATSWTPGHRGAQPGPEFRAQWRPGPQNSDRGTAVQAWRRLPEGAPER